MSNETKSRKMMGANWDNAVQKLADLVGIGLDMAKQLAISLGPIALQLLIQFLQAKRAGFASAKPANAAGQPVACDHSEKCDETAKHCKAALDCCETGSTDLEDDDEAGHKKCCEETIQHLVKALACCESHLEACCEDESGDDGSSSPG